MAKARIDHLMSGLRERRAVGACLRGAREARGLSLRDVQGLTGLHWVHIGQIERGERRLTGQAIYAMAAAIGCDAASLIALERSARHAETDLSLDLEIGARVDPVVRR